MILNKRISLAAENNHATKVKSTIRDFLPKYLSEDTEKLKKYVADLC